MRTLFYILLLLPLLAFADGLPYHADGELTGECIVIRMDNAQFKEVDTRRTVTLTKPQKDLLGRLFKRVPDRLSVVSAAFNDNREEAADAEVHCIWLRDRTLVITYAAEYASVQPENYREQASFSSAADPERLVISHDAKVYRDGKPLSFTDVFRLIDELAKTPPEKGNAYIGVPPPQSRLMLDSPVAPLYFSLPPPNKDAVDLDIAPAALLQAFTVYGVTKNVQVNSTW